MKFLLSFLIFFIFNLYSQSTIDLGPNYSIAYIKKINNDIIIDGRYISNKYKTYLSSYSLNTLSINWRVEEIDSLIENNWPGQIIQLNDTIILWQTINYLNNFLVKNNLYFIKIQSGEILKKITFFPNIFYRPISLFYDKNRLSFLIIPNLRDSLNIFKYDPTKNELETISKTSGYFGLRLVTIFQIRDSILILSNPGTETSTLILMNNLNNIYIHNFPAFDLETCIDLDTPNTIYSATSELGPFYHPSVYIHKIQINMDSLTLIKRTFVDSGYVKHITKTHNDFILVLIGEPNYPSYKDKAKLYALNTNMEVVNKYIISRNYPLAMDIDENYCYIGVITENDSYKIIIEPLSKILKTDTETYQYYHYYLSQNYPNPFNSSTRIKFTLPEMTKVTLKVYNILGQEVATILENKELRAGHYDYEFNATGLTSGTYIYRIVAGNFIQTKKMVLIK